MRLRFLESMVILEGYILSFANATLGFQKMGELGAAEMFPGEGRPSSSCRSCQISIRAYSYCISQLSFRGTLDLSSRRLKK